MADAAQNEGLSKSAKRRAAKKARDAAAEVETKETPAPVDVKPKAKAKAEPAKEEAKPATPEPKAKAKAKAKAEPKAEAKAAPAPAAEEPKAKAKAKAKAESAPAKAKPAAKPAAKAAAAKKEEEEPAPKKKEEPEFFVQLDDGSGGAWEVSSGVSKKQQKRKEKKEEEEKIQAAMAAQAKVTGVKPGAPGQHIPGMAPAPQAAGKPAASQSLVASPAAVAAAEEKKVEPGSVATIKVPESKIGIVIGPKGSKIKMIQEKTGVNRIDTTGEVFTITGPPQAVGQAEFAIRELIEKGYTSLSFDDFTENFVKVHPSSFPDLIGKQGAVVRKIKEELSVEVNFPDVPKNAASSKTYKVTLAGSTANVEKAKQVITDICTYFHHELTHPGWVHEELDIEPWAHRFIIGKGGSEMKHIQHNWKVKVNIPRDHSANKNVVVVGEKDQVERAKAYIEKMIWNAMNQTSGRDKVDDGDVWGEEEEEDWMKQYMYKRT